MALLRRPLVQTADDSGYALPNEPRMLDDAGGDTQIDIPSDEPRMLNPEEPMGDIGTVARSGEAPRDREVTTTSTLRPPSTATPLAPMAPTPKAGTPMSGPGGGAVPGGPAGPSVGGPIPFAPMAGARGLFGRNKGLQGGGLGLMSPTAGAENQSIDQLLQQLLAKGKGPF